MSFYSAGMDIWNHILSYILGKSIELTRKNMVKNARENNECIMNENGNASSM